MLSAFLGSFLAHTERPYDLFVFDYVSCEVMGDYLEQLRTAEHTLCLKENMGKIDAF